MNEAKPLRIYTIGHSTRSMDGLLDLLEEFGVTLLVDVRRFPASRLLPHFNRQALSEALQRRGVDYLWIEALGGRRGGGGRDSPNAGLRSAGFRAYADYMASDEFRAAVDELLSIAGQATAALMCAEALYWRCHRRLISDYLHAHGVEVCHILGVGKLAPHVLTDSAVVAPDGTVSYPAR